jgi:hypothetical protein
MPFEGMTEPNPLVNLDVDPKLTTKLGPNPLVNLDLDPNLTTKLDPGKIISDP